MRFQFCLCFLSLKMPVIIGLHVQVGVIDSDGTKRTRRSSGRGRAANGGFGTHSVIALAEPAVGGNLQTD